MSANRIVVDTNVCDEFVERFAERVSTLKVGNPHDTDTVIGPVINSRQLERMVGYKEELRRAGARQVLGGPPEGLVLPPHVFSGIANEMPIPKNETFGPIAAVISAYGESHALQIANDIEYGLSSAVFTRDEARSLRFARGLQAGMTHINDQTVNDSLNSPFGVRKQRHRPLRREWIVRELTTEHWITVQHAPRHYPF
jgi:aldehyde dehydrogenase (NAD+)